MLRRSFLKKLAAVPFLPAFAAVPADLARSLHDQPQQWLRFPESQLLLYSQPLEVQRHDSSNIELRFTMREGTARLLLERLAKTDTPQAVAAY
jgi:hypothetical protein